MYYWNQGLFPTYEAYLKHLSCLKGMRRGDKVVFRDYAGDDQMVDFIALEEHLDPYIYGDGVVAVKVLAGSRIPLWSPYFYAPTVTNRLTIKTNIGDTVYPKVARKYVAYLGGDILIKKIIKYDAAKELAERKKNQKPKNIEGLRL